MSVIGRHSVRLWGGNRRSTLSKVISALAVTVTLLMPARLFAQDETIGLGMAWAPIAGNGFSFRKMPASGFGFQCGTIFWKSDEDSYFNAGGAILFILNRTKQTALYIPAGIGFSYDHREYMETEDDSSKMGREVRETSSDLAGGLGIGFTGRTWSNIWVSFDLVVMAQSADILPMPQVAVHYFLR